MTSEMRTTKVTSKLRYIRSHPNEQQTKNHTYARTDGQAHVNTQRETRTEQTIFTINHSPTIADLVTQTTERRIRSEVFLELNKNGKKGRKK